MSPDTHHTVINIVDGVAAVIAVASLAGLLPQAAALFTIVWTGMRIYEMLHGKSFSESGLAKWITGRA